MRDRRARTADGVMVCNTTHSRRSRAIIDMHVLISVALPPAAAIVPVRDVGSTGDRTLRGTDSINGSIADRTVAALSERGEDDRWLVSSFRIETIDRCRSLAPGIRTAWLVGEVPDDVIATMVSRGHAALHPWFATLHRSHIDACHGAGIVVNTWTCDDPQRMIELIEWGIDGICTNVPDVAIEVIARCGRATIHAPGSEG